MDFTKIHPVKYLIASCLTLSTIRLFIEWDMIYLFLVWNLFLAWIPFGMAAKMHTIKHKSIYLAALALGLLFIPNASYLITDFVHFRKGVHINLWFDLVLFFTYAFTGLMITMYTIDLLSISLAKRYNQSVSRLFQIGIFPIIGCGIYVGRIGRWNSWDVFVQPFSFINDMIELVTSHQVVEMIAFSTLFGGFCAMFYLFLKVMRQDHHAVQVQHQSR